MSMPAIVLKSSPAKCAGAAMPAEEKLNFPGCFFASSTSSFAVDTPSAGLTNRPLSLRPTAAIGRKSVRGL